MNKNLSEYGEPAKLHTGISYLMHQIHWCLSLAHRMPHPLHSTARFYTEYKHKDSKAYKCHISQKITKQIMKIKNGVCTCEFAHTNNIKRKRRNRCCHTQNETANISKLDHMVQRGIKDGLEEWACSREKDKRILRLLIETSFIIGRLQRRVIKCNYHRMMREWWDKCDGRMGENKGVGNDWVNWEESMNFLGIEDEMGKLHFWISNLY